MKQEAIKHVEFSCALYECQVQEDRHFLHAHPWTGKSWKFPRVAECLRHLTVDIAYGHVCQFRMTSHIEHRGGEMGLVKKPIGLMTSSKRFMDELNTKCEGGHDHVPLIAGSATGTAIYPELLREAICAFTFLFFSSEGGCGRHISYLFGAGHIRH